MSTLNVMRCPKKKKKNTPHVHDVKKKKLKQN